MSKSPRSSLRHSRTHVSDENVEKKKRKSGIPTGNAGEYLVMGELLRRGFDAQLADRNTKGYDLVAGMPDRPLKRIQVKTVRVQPWFVRQSSFEGQGLEDITAYVLLGPEDNEAPARFFIVRNGDVAALIHRPEDWDKTAFLRLKAILQYENNWDLIRS